MQQAPSGRRTRRATARRFVDGDRKLSRSRARTRRPGRSRMVSGRRPRCRHAPPRSSSGAGHSFSAAKSRSRALLTPAHIVGGGTPTSLAASSLVRPIASTRNHASCSSDKSWSSAVRQSMLETHARNGSKAGSPQAGLRSRERWNPSLVDRSCVSVRRSSSETMRRSRPFLSPAWRGTGLRDTRSKHSIPQMQSHQVRSSASTRDSVRLRRSLKSVACTASSASSSFLSTCLASRCTSS